MTELGDWRRLSKDTYEWEEQGLLVTFLDEEQAPVGHDGESGWWVLGELPALLGPYPSSADALQAGEKLVASRRT